MRDMKRACDQRWLCVPGVHYAPTTEDRVRQKDVPWLVRHKKKHRIAFSVPRWAVSTKEAAEMLGVSMSTTRQLLHLARVRCVVVKRPGLSPTLCWDRKRVQERAALVQELLVSVPPKGCIPFDEAMGILGVGRSTLYRYVRAGKLREYKVIVDYPKEAGGRRLKCYYSRDEVDALAVRLRRRRGLDSEVRSVWLGDGKEVLHG